MSKLHENYRAKSSTYVEIGTPINLTYGAASKSSQTYFSGTLGKDTFQIVDSGGNNLVLPAFNFMRTTATNDKGALADQDGLVGLAFPAASADPASFTPAVTAAIAGGLLNASIFTAYLEVKGGLADNVTGGVFTFGGIDTTNCGPVIGKLEFYICIIFAHN